MGRQAAARRQPQARLFDQALDIASAQAVSANTDEYRRLAVIFGLREAEANPFREVSRQCSRRKVPKRDNTLLSAFPKDAHQLLCHVDVFIIQAHKLTNTQTARIKHLQDGPIPEIP